MTDEELRALVRATVERHLGRASPAPPPAAHQPPQPPQPPPLHPSFGRYRIVRATGDTTCLIEPQLSCSHCGYCQAHGH